MVDRDCLRPRHYYVYHSARSVYPRAQCNHPTLTLTTAMVLLNQLLDGLNTYLWTPTPIVVNYSGEFNLTIFQVFAYQCERNRDHVCVDEGEIKHHMAWLNYCSYADLYRTHLRYILPGQRRPPENPVWHTGRRKRGGLSPRSRARFYERLEIVKEALKREWIASLLVPTEPDFVYAGDTAAWDAAAAAPVELLPNPRLCDLHTLRTPRRHGTPSSRGGKSRRQRTPSPPSSDFVPETPSPSRPRQFTPPTHDPDATLVEFSHPLQATSSSAKARTTIWAPPLTPTEEHAVAVSATTLNKQWEFLKSMRREILVIRRENAHLRAELRAAKAAREKAQIEG